MPERSDLLFCGKYVEQFRRFWDVSFNRWENDSSYEIRTENQFIFGAAFPIQTQSRATEGVGRFQIWRVENPTATILLMTSSGSFRFWRILWLKIDFMSWWILLRFLSISNRLLPNALIAQLLCKARVNHFINAIRCSKWPDNVPLYPQGKNGMPNELRILMIDAVLI